MSDFDSNPFADPEAANPFAVSGDGVTNVTASRHENLEMSNN